MLITADDVAVSMAREQGFTDVQKRAVEDIIEGLEADLQAWLKRPLVPTQVEDEEIKLTGKGKAYLKKTPVVSVASFSARGSVIAAGDFDVAAWGISSLTGLFWPSSLLVPAPAFLVSYTGGLPGDDPESDFGRLVRSKLKAAARRDANQVVLEKAAGVARMAVEGTSIDFTGGVKAGEGGWLDAELEAFRRWKRRTART